MDYFNKLQKYFICFVLYAVLGWSYEVILETFIYQWGFTNRGVLFGPYCPVYGVGAMSFLLCLGKLMRKKDIRWLNIIKPIIIFIGCGYCNFNRVDGELYFGICIRIMALADV